MPVGDADMRRRYPTTKCSFVAGEVSYTRYEFLYLGVADGVSIARVWARRYSK